MIEAKRAPDLTGVHRLTGRPTRAWLAPRSPTAPAALDHWVVQLDEPGPWSAWVVAVVHLRPVPGMPPAHVTAQGATHELSVIALSDKDHTIDPDDVETLGPAQLRPLNYVRQFEVRSDAEACQLTESLVRAFTSGALPIEPDVFVIRQDGRVDVKSVAVGAWTPARAVYGCIDATAKCIREGNHAPH